MSENLNQVDPDVDVIIGDERYRLRWCLASVRAVEDTIGPDASLLTNPLAQRSAFRWVALVHAALVFHHKNLTPDAVHVLIVDHPEAAGEIFGAWLRAWNLCHRKNPLTIVKPADEEATADPSSGPAGSTSGPSPTTTLESNESESSGA